MRIMIFQRGKLVIQVTDRNTAWSRYRFEERLPDREAWRSAAQQGRLLVVCIKQIERGMFFFLFFLDVLFIAFDFAFQFLKLCLLLFDFIITRKRYRFKKTYRDDNNGDGVHAAHQR